MVGRGLLNIVAVAKTAMLKPLTDNEATEARLSALHPFRGFGEPEDIAKVAVFLASDDASWITGVALPVDGKSFMLAFFGVSRAQQAYLLLGGYIAR